MSYETRLALLPHSFEGAGFRCTPAKCANAMALHLESDGSGMKTRAMWLAEALNGRWTGRDKAYLLSPRRAALWRRLYLAGFDACIWMFVGPERKLFQFEGHEDMTEREAVALLNKLEAVMP